MDIDAIIAEAQAPVAAQAQPEIKEEPQPEGGQDPAATEAPQSEEAEQAEAPKQEEFPKKARNAISYRDKKIGKLSAELQAERLARQELEKRFTGEPQAAKAEGEPKESDFENYGDYLRAFVRWEKKQEIQEHEAKTRAESQKAELESWEAERGQVFDESVKTAKKTFSDYAQILDEYAAEYDDLPTHVLDAAFELENGASALYMAAKDGVLEKLAQTRSATQAGIMLAKLEEKALAASKSKPLTKSPTPMTPVKGIAAVSTPIEKMSPKEILKIARGG